MTQGWQCPNCGKAHSPSVQTCPEPASYPVLSPVYYPAPRYYTRPFPQPSIMPCTPWPYTITCQTTAIGNTYGYEN